MNDLSIRVDNLGKLYRLGEVGTGTISHDLNRWWARMRGKEDPFATIGETNDRTKSGSSDYVWALKNVSFEVRKGQVLGIIGRNGAGKSTLLKILSKVTKPSEGRLNINGRIASLLEVGTGFHPELTGRENIFQNGAILGMTKAEIRSKFDEIVDFAGVERYIDTPVKRYSSGMYVRLAFAVAAFLEPEILIVDEVLAVGDAEFQKKCIGRMKDVSVNDGRTVLFVSHNMGAIRSLCDTVLCMEHGTVKFEGPVNAGVNLYLDNKSNLSQSHYRKEERTGASEILEVTVVNDESRTTSEFEFESQVAIAIKYRVEDRFRNALIGIRIIDKEERIVFTSEHPISALVAAGGTYTAKVLLPKGLLVPNRYTVNTGINIPNVQLLDYQEGAVSFEIMETGTQFYMYAHADYGCVFANCQWQDVS